LKKSIVTPTAEERQHPLDLITAAKKPPHARISLRADAAEGGPAWPDHRIAEALEVGTATSEPVRRRSPAPGLDAALARGPRERPGRLPTPDGRAEARLIALACSHARPARRPSCPH